MKQVFKIILLCVAIYIVYLSFHANKCDEVLTFRIENIDKQFGVSKESAIGYSKGAADLWNNGLQKQVLKYDEKGEIKISFVYDERQRITIQNNILREKANQKTQILTAKIENITVQKENFLDLKKKFENEFQAFENDLQTYNLKIAEINKKGGATEEERASLKVEKSSLEIRKNNLENQQIQLNNYLKSINSDVTEYNTGVRNFNSVVQEINKNSLGEFEEGYFSGNKIVLYEYEDITTLKRLIAHELGHALGMDHTDEKNSIMYYINQGDKFVLTKSDVAEYNRICNNNPPTNYTKFLSLLNSVKSIFFPEATSENAYNLGKSI